MLLRYFRRRDVRFEHLFWQCPSHERSGSCVRLNITFSKQLLVSAQDRVARNIKLLCELASWRQAVSRFKPGAEYRRAQLLIDPGVKRAITAIYPKGERPHQRAGDRPSHWDYLNELAPKINSILALLLVPGVLQRVANISPVRENYPRQFSKTREARLR